MENPLRKNHFAQVYRSFSSNKNKYSPRTIDKPALKWISLTRASILGQSPMCIFFKDHLLQCEQIY